ncbi:hypothetical protein Droror1_Dr00026346 [Drosera rotundifolia]
MEIETESSNMESEMIMAFGALKRNTTARPLQWHLQITINSRLIMPSFDKPDLEPDPQIQPHADLEHPIAPLRVKLLHISAPKGHCVSPHEPNGTEKRRVFMALVEPGDRRGGEYLILEVVSDFYVVVVDAQMAVRVTSGECEGEVVGEGGGGGEGELSERGGGDVEVDPVGPDNEVEDEDDEADEDEDAADDGEDAAQHAVAYAVQATTATPAPRPMIVGPAGRCCWYWVFFCEHFEKICFA